MKVTSPLHSQHFEAGATFLEVGDCEIPARFSDTAAEYRALCSYAALADFSHRSRFRIEADTLHDFLNEALTIDTHQIERGRSAEAFFCNEKGGIIDQFTVYMEDNWALLLGSAAARSRSLAALSELAAEQPNWGARVIDVTAQQGQVALFGPEAQDFLEKLTLGQPVPREDGEGMIVTIGTSRTLVLRREPGTHVRFDFIAGNVFLAPLWDRLIATCALTDALPAGHHALEIARIATGVPAVGPEIDEETTPFEVNGQDHVDFRKNRFRGRRALLHSGSSEFSRNLVCIHTETELEIEPPAELRVDKLPIGRVTSVARIPGEKGQIALGFVNSIKASLGTRLHVATRAGLNHPAEIVRPHY